MGSLADEIERFLRELLEEAPPEGMELKRNALAARFGCAPSQINYVLATRFSPERGYLVETRRGGGGYIRIRRLPKASLQTWIVFVQNQIGPDISARGAEHLIERAVEEGLITVREAALIQTVLDRTADFWRDRQDELRAAILRDMLIALFGKNCDM